MHWLLYSTCARFEFVKSPEVTLCGRLGYKPSINKWMNWTWFEPRIWSRTLCRLRHPVPPLSALNHWERRWGPAGTGSRGRLGLARHLPLAVLSVFTTQPHTPTSVWDWLKNKNNKVQAFYVVERGWEVCACNHVVCAHCRNLFSVCSLASRQLPSVCPDPDFLLCFESLFGTASTQVSSLPWWSLDLSDGSAQSPTVF